MGRLETLSIVKKTTGNLVKIKNDVAFADSLQIAEHFEIQHKSVITRIEKLRETDEKIGHLTALSFYTDSMNRKQKKYFLTKDAFIFVVQKFKGTKVHKWQWMYIEAFNKMEAMVREKQSTEWQLTRQKGKMVRRSETDAVAIFIKYAQDQGSKNSGHYYKHFTSVVHKAVGINDGERNILTIEMLVTISSFENQVSAQIMKAIETGEPYKNIYQTVKAKIEVLSEIMIMPEDKYLPSPLSVKKLIQE